VRDVLLVIDLLTDFGHEDGDALLASLRERLPGLRAALEAARRDDVPVVYANDHGGRFDGDRDRLLRAATSGPGADALAGLLPREDDPLVLKPRYSAFELSPLELLLSELQAERLVMVGTSTEMCVAQTAIDARERGFKVTVLTDACARIDAEMERIALTYLEHVAGCRLATSDTWRGVSAPGR
jgi:nicotinamidase-related amidase